MGGGAVGIGLAFVVMTSCGGRSAPPPSVDSLVVKRDAGAGEPFPYDYGEVCGRDAPRARSGDERVDGDSAGTADVTFRTTAEPRVDGKSSPSDDVRASLVAPSMGLDVLVFRAVTSELWQCCSYGGDDHVTFGCRLGGSEALQGEGRAWREGEELVVRWCTANLMRGAVHDRGEVRARVPARHGVRYEPSRQNCAQTQLP